MIATPATSKHFPVGIAPRPKSIPAPGREPDPRLNSSSSTAMNRTHRNLVGTEIRRRRRHLGWSQSRLARHLQLAGLRISRSGLAKVECGMLWVGDFELLYFARVLGLGVQDLFPNIKAEESLSGVLTVLLGTPRTRSKGKP
jgi:ribosome-binding protein aMBF1 (putative translation factor)